MDLQILERPASSTQSILLSVVNMKECHRALWWIFWLAVFGLTVTLAAGDLGTGRGRPPGGRVPGGGHQQPLEEAGAPGEVPGHHQGGDGGRSLHDGPYVQIYFRRHQPAGHPGTGRGRPPGGRVPGGGHQQPLKEAGAPGEVPGRHQGGDGGRSLLDGPIRQIRPRRQRRHQPADQEEVKKVAVGSDLVLLPDVTDVITDILWQDSKGNKVAEWIKTDGPDIDYYGRFKNTGVIMNITTAMLSISNITEQDRGNFTVTINALQDDHNKKYSKTFRVEITRIAAHKTEVTGHGPGIGVTFMRSGWIGGAAAHNETDVTGHGAGIGVILGGVFGIIGFLVVAAAVVWLVRHRGCIKTVGRSESAVDYTAGRPAEGAEASTEPEVQVGVQQSLLDHPNGA